MTNDSASGARSHLSVVERVDRDQVVEIAGETIIVREFRGFEYLKARILARPFLDKLRDLIRAGQKIPDVVEVHDLIADHAEIFVELIASVCGAAPPERRGFDWVAGLRTSDYEKIQLAFFDANVVCLIRPVLLEVDKEITSARLSAQTQPQKD
jgi:hypothetical protein